MDTNEGLSRLKGADMYLQVEGQHCQSLLDSEDWSKRENCSINLAFVKNMCKCMCVHVVCVYVCTRTCLHICSHTYKGTLEEGRPFLS